MNTPVIPCPPRVIVIDDNPAIHDDFRKILCPQASDRAADQLEADIFGERVDTGLPPERYDLETALQGQEGLEKILAAVGNGVPFSLAFVDGRMPPGWDGVETIHRIWKQVPDIQIVFCTAFSDYSWREVLSKIGGNDNLIILKKPFDNIEVAQLARAMTKKWELNKMARLNTAALEDIVRARTEQLAVQVDDRTRSLSDANKQLGKAAKHKDEFLASMSHELRTPLNAVLGLSEAMIEEVYGPVTDRQRLSLTHISESGRHLLSLINDILDLSKIEAGKMKLEPGLVEIRPLVEMSLRFVREAAQKKGIRLGHDLGSDVETFVGDERRLKQMLINLLSNAVKFTPESGSIRVSTRLTEDGNSVEFAVADSGIGISPADQGKLFQSFVQLDSGLSREYSGTGLGLALVRKMAEMHGGTVGVSSAPGEGSRFSFTIPLDPSWIANGENVSTPAVVPAQVVRETGQATKPAAPGTRRPVQVLIAEDNEINVLTIKDYLIKQGFHLTIAPNGVEALRLAREIRPDIILMDVQMPVMDGVEATRRIRCDRELSKTPVIMLTALAMAGDRERCLDAGADEYVAKPFSLRGLVETMHRQLRANGIDIPASGPG